MKKTLKICFLLSVLTVLVSCSFFSKKQQTTTSTDTIIDFTSVDTYPVFSTCKETLNHKNQKDCFYTEFSKHISTLLKSKSFQIQQNSQDTILIKLQINKKGNVSLVNTSTNPPNPKIISNIDSILHSELQKFPTLQPATKRGIPVTTVFTLPLILTF